jgi:dipeptidyl aminopeptidase/acylaminoacyl peptidase
METKNDLPGVSWGDFRAAEARLAEAGHDLLRWTGESSGMLATVRDGGPPRIHPVNVGVVGDDLFVFVLGSAKRTDLERDGRYALHAHQNPSSPSEFLVRGHALQVTDPATRTRVAATWPFEIDDAYGLFELRIVSVLLGQRPTPDDWPPAYTTWRTAG